MQLANSPAAALTGVVKKYGEKTALDGVSLNIPRGSVTALLGPNGAGKSTAVGLMLGLVTADAGRVELFGRAPQEVVARRKIGLCERMACVPNLRPHAAIRRLRVKAMRHRRSREDFPR